MQLPDMSKNKRVKCFCYDRINVHDTFLFLVWVDVAIDRWCRCCAKNTCVSRIGRCACAWYSNRRKRARTSATTRGQWG